MVKASRNKAPCGEIIIITSGLAKYNSSSNLRRAFLVFSTFFSISFPIDGIRSGGWGVRAAKTNDINIILIMLIYANDTNANWLFAVLVYIRIISILLTTYFYISLSNPSRNFVRFIKTFFGVTGPSQSDDHVLFFGFS